MSNKNLQDAKHGKKDEFYTQYEDIEKEVINYKDFFYGKTVYCNCDAPDSNFVKFFEDHFDEFGLKKLIHTSIQEGVDFRSNESIELLKESDIVVTNPPFSLFREYVAQLMYYDKKFLIMGNVNAITYKEFFPLLKENKIWLGYNADSSNKKYNVPEDYPLIGLKSGVDKNGHKYIYVKGIRWFTNLEHQKRHEKLILTESYQDTPEKYPHYDNYDAIEVSRVKDIPKDYEGIMGVPITFMDKYNPEQFEILGNSTNLADIVVLPNGVIKCNPQRFYVNGHRLYERIAIRKKGEI